MDYEIDTWDIKRKMPVYKPGPDGVWNQFVEDSGIARVNMEPKINLLLVLSISCSPGVLADKIYMRRAKALDGASGYIYSSDSALTPQFAELDTRSYPALTAGKFDELAPFTTEGYGESSEQLINNAGLNSIVYAVSSFV